MEQSQPQPATRGETVSSLRWSSVGLTGTEVIRVAFGLLLARLLGPENYGIIAQATVYVALTSVFLDQGFSATLIRKPDLTRVEQGSVFRVSFGSAVAVAALTIAVAPAIASFFRTPELTGILRVLAISVVLKGLSIVPLALLARALRFRRVALTEVIGAVSAGAVGVVAALEGAEYWSFVAMTLTLDVVILIGASTGAGRPALGWSWPAFRRLLSFSANSMGFQLVNYGSRNLDNVIVGRTLGATALGHYALSYRIMMLPIQSLGRVVTRVSLPIYSRLEHDRPRLREQYVLGTQMLAVATFPPMIIIMVVSPIAVPLILGSAWAPAVLPIQILAFTGMRQAVNLLSSSVLLACGRADWQFRFGLVASGLTIVSFFVGVQGGIVGVALAYTIVSLGLMPILASLSGRLIGLSIWSWMAVLVPPAVCGGVGGLLGALLTWSVEQAGASPWVAMSAGAAGVLVGFAATLMLGWRERAQKILGVAGALAGREPTKVAA